jgi:predicted  nucleic acid-binding Zn-ribbon protein
VAPDLDSYRAGHAEGVRVYCRESNGFAVGHSGATYQGVCPADLEAAFVSEYNSGRRLHDLESALASVDARIAGNYRAQEGIKQELTDIAALMIATDTTAEQRLAMVTRSAELGRRYGELTTEIQQLQRDRALAERDLLDYRATLAAAF